MIDSRDIPHGTGGIECIDLSKTFHDTRTGRHVVALRGFDLRVAPHEIITLLGPSGCGKSTLLNIIAGFEQPTTGSVLVGGHPVRKPGPDRGVVFQDHALFPWLTVEENVAYGLRESGMPKKERLAIANDFIDMVGLTGFNQLYPHELSGGMQQRVGIGRVLAIGPKILLMDEPFGALDAQTRSILQGELLSIWERTKVAVVFVTHNVEEAVFLGHRVVVVTARPGTVKQVIEVQLPVDEREVTSDEFNVYRRQATLSIEEEVDRSRVLDTRLQTVSKGIDQATRKSSRRLGASHHYDRLRRRGRGHESATTARPAETEARRREP